MFDLSFGEILFALVVAFVIFGPERFPVMLREAIGWIKKIKNLAFEAQRSLDDLGKNIKDDLPDINSWTQPGAPTIGSPGPSGSPLKPIEIDRDPDDYSTKGVNWRETMNIDRHQGAYRLQELKAPPWREG